MKDEKDLGAQSAAAVESAGSIASAAAPHVAPWHLRTANGKLPVVREIKQPHGEASHYHSVVGSGDTLCGPIVVKLDFGYGREDNERVAHLISAAPELLEALKALLFDLEGHAVVDGRLTAAESAIAKAEGRS